MNKTKKVRRIVLAVAILSLLTGYSILEIKNTDDSKKNREITAVRKQHREFLDTDQYNKTEEVGLTRMERIAKGLPPNAYFEQMRELTMNPRTGKTEPEQVAEILESLRLEEQNSISKAAPGDSKNNAWKERGPNNVGGRTRALLFDPNDSNRKRVYAGGVSGGLWVNDDITSSSSKWSQVTNVPGNLSVSSITVDPKNSKVWYLGTGEQHTQGDVVGNGVYKSTDGGKKWTALKIPAAGPGDISLNASSIFLSGIYYVNDIIAWNNKVKNRTELFVGIGGAFQNRDRHPRNWLGLQNAGLYHSIDGGKKWRRIQSNNMKFRFENKDYYYIPNDFEIGSDNRLWMGSIESEGPDIGGGRIFSSKNGTNWTEAAVSPLPNGDRVELETSSQNPNKLYALVQGGANNAPIQIYRTNNGFRTATKTRLPNDIDPGIPANDFARGQSYYNLTIEADPKEDNIVYVGGIDLFRSTDNGKNWSQISKWNNDSHFSNLKASVVHADQHALVFRPGNKNQAIIANDGGVYFARSLSTADKNDVIHARNKGYNVTQFVKASIGPNGKNDTKGIITAGAQDNGTQAFRKQNISTGINSSEEMNDGDGFNTFIDKDGQYAISTLFFNNIYRFKLPWNGKSRIQGGGTALVNNNNEGHFVNEMGYDSKSNVLLSNATTFNSANNTFTPKIRVTNVAKNQSRTITSNSLPEIPTAFRASPFSNDVWYVGLRDGGLFRLTNVKNESVTWKKIQTPFVGSVSSVRFGSNEDKIMVTMYNYGVKSVWYTNNGGTNWTNKEGNLPNIPVRDILQNPLNKKEVILATQIGVWGTTNFFASKPVWKRYTNGMKDVSVTSFDYWEKKGNKNNNVIIASTYGRGVFTGKFTATTKSISETPENSNHSKFDLSLYPNPVTNNTVFIDTKADTPLTYKIISISGRTILEDTLQNNEIDVTKLSKGIYILQATTANSEKTIKQFVKK